MARTGHAAAILALALTVSACATFSGDSPTVSEARPAGATTTTLPAVLPSSAPPPAVAPPPAPPATVVPPPRVVADVAYTPFASAAGLVLTHPSARVERVGFHESNHDGARQLDPLPGAVGPTIMEARDRGTAGRTAADVVVDPTAEIRSPVTGRVKRAGTYVLYCRHSDDYVVIAPDQNPAWEVKILHIDGVQVRRGQRVTAGETVLAPRATQLPFESQVDELATTLPAWPHTHIEVVDPTIRDRPNANNGCD